MAGYDLKSGNLIKTKVSDDELWSYFNYVFSDSCKKTNTYKFGLIKSICDQVYDLLLTGAYYFLSYDKLFIKFTENYWNLVNKYHLKQMTYNGSSEYSKIERILMEAADKYEIPEKISFQSLEKTTKDIIAHKVSMECKKYVIGALYNDFQGCLYSFDLKGEGIYLSTYAYSFISKYKYEIEKINYYSWAKYLEKINDDSVLVRVLEKLELATPKRKDLSVYREILYKEFEENTCFYCSGKLKEDIHVDHFIPWTFVKTDNLWNFVLACPKCNLKKHDKLMKHDYLKKLNNRNSKIIDNTGNSAFIQTEFQSYYTGLLDRMWEYARMSGIQEYR